MSDQYITLSELCREHGADKSNFRKYILRQGFSFVRIRAPETNGQLALALTLEDAEVLRDLRGKQGFANTTTIVDDGYGYFYIVQLVPEFDPRRVKLGFASNANARLQAHRTSAPTAELIKAWPCKRTWEQTVIDSVTRIGCILVANEVFTCDSIDAIIERCEQFFSLMPD